MLQRHFVAELPTNTLNIVEPITHRMSLTIWYKQHHWRHLPLSYSMTICVPVERNLRYSQEQETTSMLVPKRRLSKRTISSKFWGTFNCSYNYRLYYIVYNISTNLWTSRMMPGFGQDWISKPRINNSVDSSDKSRISSVRFSSIPL